MSCLIATIWPEAGHEKQAAHSAPCFKALCLHACPLVCIPWLLVARLSLIEDSAVHMVPVCVCSIICLFVCTCMCAHVWFYVYIYVCVCVYICVCVCVCVCTRTSACRGQWTTLGVISQVPTIVSESGFLTDLSLPSGHGWLSRENHLTLLLPLSLRTDLSLPSRY